MDDGFDECADRPEPSMRQQLLAARADVERHLEILENPGSTGLGSGLFRPKRPIQQLTATLAEIDRALRLSYPDDT